MVSDPEWPQKTEEEFWLKEEQEEELSLLSLTRKELNNDYTNMISKILIMAPCCDQNFYFIQSVFIFCGI